MMRIKPTYVLAALSTVLLLAACSKGTEVIGKPAPPFEVASFDGAAVSPSLISPEGHKGEPLLIYFFASW